RAIKLAWIAECSRHYEKSSLHYEGQRPVALPAGITRSRRVAFLRQRKNAKCINRGIRPPRALPWAMSNNWAFHNVGCTRQFEQAQLPSFARHFSPPHFFSANHKIFVRPPQLFF
ncbi:MAG: hypothetical protein ACOCNO_08235, partial [Bacteroidales bacterium]